MHEEPIRKMSTTKIIHKTGMKRRALAKICDVSYNVMSAYSVGRTEPPALIRRQLEHVLERVQKIQALSED